MNLNTLKVAILGYGNQGRAQALNLRDSGVPVIVGARPGKGFETAKKDGFTPLEIIQAAEMAQVLLFLLPDHIIPETYQSLSYLFSEGQREVGFSHGYAYHFGGIQRFEKTGYFLVGPKGAGWVLRESYQRGEKIPGVLAIESVRKQTREIAVRYAEAIGLNSKNLVETTFQEETECDLFGEQVVLCGGILELMESAFELLLERGYGSEMAFYECCYEAKRILDLWLEKGPIGLSESISPTAFFGGFTRGRRLINEEVKKEMGLIFEQIKKGKFSQEWDEEVRKNFPTLKGRKAEQEASKLQKTYNQIKKEL